MPQLAALLAEIRACTHCAAHLPLGPRPVIRAAESARIMIIGQAPGTRVHETGIPWNDASGDRLRGWLQLDRETFYDETRIAIMPMGFCYPGVINDPRIGEKKPAGGGAGETTKGSDGGIKKGGGAGDGNEATNGGKKGKGDAPPRPECAPLWHERVWADLPNVRLTLLAGSYAQAHYLGAKRGKTLTETVRDYRNHLDEGFIPLPHPSWRTIGWQKQNLWFETELLPLVRARVTALL